MGFVGELGKVDVKLDFREKLKLKKIFLKIQKNVT